MNKRDDDGNISYRPLFFARVYSENHEPFIMQMTAEWFKAAKSYLASSSLGRSVHHVKGDQVQPTLNSQVHPKGFTPNGWEFEVLTKMVVIQKQEFASEEWLAYTSAFLAPSQQQSTPQESNRDLSQETKGEARQKIRKNTEPTNYTEGTSKKRIRIEAKAFMAYSELALNDDSGIPYRLIQNEPTPAPTKPTFSTKDQDNGNTLTQITDDLVALHIGYTPKLH
jgi:hypothetical protein